MWIVTTMLLAVVGVGLMLTGWVAYRTADAAPDNRTPWPLVALAVACGGLGVWTFWTAAFIMSGNL